MDNKNKRRVLFFTAFPPSNSSAAEKNTKRMLEEFGNGYTVDLVYYKDANVEEYNPGSDNVNVLRVIPNSRKYRITNALKHLLYHPLFTVRYEKKIMRWMQNLVDRIDYSAIVFDHSQMFMFAKKIKYEGIKVLLSHDIEAQRVRRSSNYLQYLQCFYTEKNVLSTRGAHLFTLCQKDADLIKDLYKLSASVVNVYIDQRIESFTPHKVSDYYVLFGNWVRQDNYEGALWLLNGIGDFLNNPIKVLIIGKMFPIDRIKKHSKVRIENMGFVDNPYPIIGESKAMLCPLFSGAGIKVKVIESLASGTPVIGTDIAFEGFSEKFEAFMSKSQDLFSFANIIETIDYSLEERMSFKALFLNEYTSTTIPRWLDKNL